MKLDHLTLDQLKLSPLNVRRKGGEDVSDLLPSIRRLGILQPLLVRPNCEGFEIVAGQRRFLALTRLKEEGIAEPVPCIVMDDGDDALAIEASLTENIARLPMDEIDQYKAFASLRGEGLDVAEIAARFGVTERLVSQRLAIAGIIEPILNACRRDEIDAETLRILTMATPRQQKAWWKLHRSKDEYAPTGRRLKDWLFGGAHIPVANALFDERAYRGAIVSDLFSEDRYFADAEAFWPLQNSAIAEARNAHLAKGWQEVVVLDIGKRFATWEHEKVAKSKGGKVFIAITHDGEVAFHEGWISMKEARRKAKAQETGEAAPKTARPELTKAMQNYLGLHKHAAVRTELLAYPRLALRLAVAHMIAGSPLWTVRADPQRPDSQAIGESVNAASATASFERERNTIGRMLGFEEFSAEHRGGRGKGRSLLHTFQSLIDMDDGEVLRILAFVMAETLEAHSKTVDAVGTMFSTDMGKWWKADGTFFDLLRDKEAINAMVREIAGDMTADAHVASTSKVQKKIIADCLSGDNGRAKIEGWLPHYMGFPASGYTSRFTGRAEVVVLDIMDEREIDDDEAADIQEAAA